MTGAIAGGVADTRRNQHEALKGRLHQELLSVLDLARLPHIRREDAEREIRAIIATILARETQTTPLSLVERDRLTDDVLNELFGLGPLEGLLRDPEVSDILGEVRGEEAIDMLQAMNTGHDGSLTTIHANTPRDALHRLDTMVAMANLSLPDKAVRQQITSAIHVIVQVSRLSDGTRKVTTISEITGMEGDVISLHGSYGIGKEHDKKYT